MRTLQDIARGLRELSMNTGRADVSFWLCEYAGELDKHVAENVCHGTMGDNPQNTPRVPPPEDGLYLVTAQGNVTMFEWFGPPSDAEALQKLPKTQDGVRLAPGDSAWHAHDLHGRPCEPVEGKVEWHGDPYAFLTRLRLPAGKNLMDVLCYHPIEECYSTREAAEAAEDHDE